MARTGPTPLPTNVKILQGNRGKRDLSKKTEPEPEAGEPDKPEYLTGFASEEWDRLVKITMDIGVLTKADGDMLELYCMEKSNYLQAKKDLEENGELYKRNSSDEIYGAHPATLIMDKAAKNMRQILAEFGLSPSARTRVHVKKKEEKKGKFEGM